MSYAAAAKKTLSSAESELRQLIQRALATGAYREVARLAELADGLSKLAGMAASDSTGSELRPPTPRRAVPPAADRQSTTEVALKGLDSLPPSPRRARSTKYPQFERDGDRLIKIAWSKKARAPYEHRAPREVVSRVLDAILRIGEEGRQFEANDIFPLVDPRTKHEVPSYQAYMALAWLRSAGLVSKRGREGYVLQHGSATKDELDLLWNSLTQRA